MRSINLFKKALLLTTFSSFALSSAFAMEEENKKNPPAPVKFLNIEGEGDLENQWQEAIRQEKDQETLRQLCFTGFKYTHTASQKEGLTNSEKDKIQALRNIWNSRMRKLVTATKEPVFNYKVLEDDPILLQTYFNIKLEENPTVNQQALPISTPSEITFEKDVSSHTSKEKLEESKENFTNTLKNYIHSQGGEPKVKVEEVIEETTQTVKKMFKNNSGEEFLASLFTLGASKLKTHMGHNAQREKNKLLYGHYGRDWEIKDEKRMKKKITMHSAERERELLKEMGYRYVYNDNEKSLTPLNK